MLRRKNFILFLCAILLIGIVYPPKQTNAAEGSVMIGTDDLNVRTGPGLSYPTLGIAKKGDRYPLLSQQNEWIQIDYGNGDKGWVADWLVVIESGSQESNSNANLDTHATITTDGLRLRTGPGTGFQVLGIVNKGESYQILEENNDWVQLRTSFGDGWVSSDYVGSQSQTNNQPQAETSETPAVKMGTILTNSLNVRSQPSLSGEVIGKLQTGEKVKILSQSNEWTEISFSGKSAWISSQFIELENGQKNPSESANTSTSTEVSGTTGTVTATTLIVRDSSDLNGTPIGTVSQGASFIILEEENNWAKIEYQNGEFGWVASWYLEKSATNSSTESKEKLEGSTVTILHNGSNIRKEANTNSSVVHRGNQGDKFEVLSLQNDWYEIKLSNGESGFVAGWIVSVAGSAPQVEKAGAEKHLKNKTIVLDPGHGGRDNGTTGSKGTLEKTLTLRTAKLLYDKLKAAGANVYMTRNSDTYIPLKSRVSSSHIHNADAFISIHYDSIADQSVKGMTSYYYHSYQENLAENLHHAVVEQSQLKDRGYRQGDYLVVRENNRSAVLLELGYLSNPVEELLITSNHYQESVTTGIYQGLARYFKE